MLLKILKYDIAAMGTERHDQFVAALRALDLAIMIHNAERIERARAVLLQLHREVMAAHEGAVVVRLRPPH